MQHIFDYYDWLFFKSEGMLFKWAEKNNKDIGLQNVDDYFRLCLELVESKDLTDEQLECFKRKMWKKGYKRLSIGCRILLQDTTPHMITFLDKNGFIDEEDKRISYIDIRSVMCIPDIPKYSKDNIKVGMVLRLVNKRYTGNLYTVTAVRRKTFDAVNGSYKFPGVEYSEIDDIIKKK